MDTIPDEILVRRFLQDRDQDALKSLVCRHQAPIFGFLLRSLEDPHRAEEAAQETFIGMLRGLPGFRLDLPFRPWLFRIALNASRKLTQRQVAQERRDRRAAESRREGDRAMNPSDVAVQRELHGLVSELPAQQRDALVLHYFQGFSHSEVASILELPAGTVSTRIHGGLETLRSRLAAMGIAIPVGGLGELLTGASCANAPSSILSTVMAEASRLAATPGAAGAVQGGRFMSQAKAFTVAAVILLLALGGGVTFYGVRPLKERQEESGPGRTLSTAPGFKGASEAPDGPRTVNEPQAQPGDASSQSATGDSKPKEGFGFDEPYDVKSELNFLNAYLNEDGAPLKSDQIADVEALLTEEGLWLTRLNEQSLPSLERQLQALKGGLDFSTRFKQIATPEQQRGFARRLHDTHQPFRAVVRGVTSEEARSAVLDAWSQHLVPLSDQERDQLSALAVTYVDQLRSAQASMAVKYGADFMASLTSSETRPIDEPGGLLETVFGAYELLFQVEREQRQAIMKLLPGKAEDVRNAPPYVVLIDSTKRDE